MVDLIDGSFDVNGAATLACRLANMQVFVIQCVHKYVFACDPFCVLFHVHMYLQTHL